MKLPYKSELLTGKELAVTLMSVMEQISKDKKMNLVKGGNISVYKLDKSRFCMSVFMVLGGKDKVKKKPIKKKSKKTKK